MTASSWQLPPTWFQDTAKVRGLCSCFAGTVGTFSGVVLILSSFFGGGTSLSRLACDWSREPSVAIPDFSRTLRSSLMTTLRIGVKGSFTGLGIVLVEESDVTLSFDFTDCASLDAWTPFVSLTFLGGLSRRSVRGASESAVPVSGTAPSLVETPFTWRRFVARSRRAFFTRQAVCSAVAARCRRWAVLPSGGPGSGASRPYCLETCRAADVPLWSPGPRGPGGR